MRIQITNGTVFPMDRGAGIPRRADVFIENGRLAAVGPGEPPFELRPGDRQIDAEGCYVLPGFVNAHGHLSLGLFRGLGEFAAGSSWESHFARQGALSEQLVDADYFLGAQLLIAEMIRAGITSFADIHYEPPGSPPVTDLIAQAVEATGIRATVCLETMGYLNTGGMQLKYDPQEASRTLQNSLAHAEKWHGRADGRITAMLGLANPPVPMPDDLERVAAAARDSGFPIQMHLAEIAQEMDEWQDVYGRGPCEALRDHGLLDHHLLIGNAVFLTEKDAEIVRDHPFHATTCPQNCCKIALGMLDIPMLLSGGVNVCLGTNEVPNNNNLDMIEEMRFAALYHKLQYGDPRVLPGDEPLRLITERGGLALGSGVGVLEPGRPADVILLDASGPHMHPAHDPLANLVYAASSADVRTVIIDGEIVMEDRRITTFDERAVIEELETRLAPLRESLPEPEHSGGTESFKVEYEVDRKESL